MENFIKIQDSSKFAQFSLEFVDAEIEKQEETDFRAELLAKIENRDFDCQDLQAKLDTFRSEWEAHGFSL